MLYLSKADPRAQEFRTWKCLFCPSRNTKYIFSLTENQIRNSLRLLCATDYPVFEGRAKINVSVNFDVINR